MYHVVALRKDDGSWDKKSFENRKEAAAMANALSPIYISDSLKYQTIRIIDENYNILWHDGYWHQEFVYNNQFNNFPN